VVSAVLLRQYDMDTIASIILIAAGVTVRLVGMFTLKENFSLTLKEPGRIVTSGIYRYIRHPCYAGSIMCLVGIAMLSATVAVIFLSAWFFLARIKEEEKILGTNQGYREYARKTGMFLPKLRK